MDWFWRLLNGFTQLRPPAAPPLQVVRGVEFLRMCKDPKQPVRQQRAGEGHEVARKASQGPLERAVEGHRRLAWVNRRSDGDALLRP